MFSGEIKMLLKSQISIPEEAVLHTGKRDLVYKMEGNKLTPVEVALGAKGGNRYQILSGLKEGDVISGGPNFLIDSEAKIRGIE
jgi:Cu(I)/Ag(I) efflux system membrane fusion protein